MLFKAYMNKTAIQSPCLRIEEIFGCRKSKILAMELMPDHVPLLLEVDPQYGIGKLIKERKGKSSRILRQRFSNLRFRISTL
jgi:putative transposase